MKKTILRILFCGVIISGCQSKQLIGVTSLKIFYVDKDIETIVAIHPNYFKYAFGSQVYTKSVFDELKLIEIDKCLTKLQEIDSTTLDTRVEVHIFRQDSLIYKLSFGVGDVIYMSPGKFLRCKCFVKQIDNITGFSLLDPL